MLDPLTALSLAGTVVQFVDFSTKLVTKTYELYKSRNGCLRVNEELEEVTLNLKMLALKLKRPLVLGDEQDEDAQALEKLCDACVRIADELVERLDRVKIHAKSGSFRSMKEALLAAFRDGPQKDPAGELDSLVRRLQMHENALKTRVLVDLRYLLNLDIFESLQIRS
jgi:hypothetical protein